MRSTAKIFEGFIGFTEEDLKNARQLFKSQVEGDKQAAFNFAFLILGTSFEQLENIPTQKLKKRFLTYRKLLAEFEFNPARYAEPDKKALAHQFMILSEIAFKYLTQTELVQSDNSNYGKHSLGLQDIFVRSSYRKVKTIQDPNQTLIVKDAKKDGVEPGFEGWLQEDLLILLQKQIPNKKKRLRYIATCEFEPSTIYSELVTDDELPHYMIKLDYQKKTNNGIVIPEEKDLERSQTIQWLKKSNPTLGWIALKLYQFYKRQSVDRINANAVREVLANDHARLFGMEVQDQRILLSQYDDGSLKVMLKSEIIAGISNIGTSQIFNNSEISLQGSLNSKHQNYLAYQTPFELGGVGYISDSSIENLGRYLPLMLVQGDYDAIGSRGQNKMRNKNRLFGIDFGHAFTAKNTVIKSLDPAFGFNRPKYKNFSIFYDTPRRSHVQGLLILAKLQGKPLEEDILRAHGEEFYEFISSLKAGEDKKIFKDYLNVFKTKHDESSPSQQPGLKAIIDNIKKAKRYAFSARKELVNKFKYYLDMPPAMIDWVENLEKLHACTQANATLLSPKSGSKVGNIVLLNHIKLINSAKRLKWQFDHTHTTYCLTLPKIRKTDKFYQVLEKKLNAVGINPEFRQGKLSIKIKKNQLDSLAKLFDEEQIKRDYLAEDYAIQCAFELKKLATDSGLFEIEISKDKLMNRYPYKLKLSTQDSLLATAFKKSTDKTILLKTNAQGVASFYTNLNEFSKISTALNELKQQIEKINPLIAFADHQLSLELDFDKQQLLLRSNGVDTQQSHYLQGFPKNTDGAWIISYERLDKAKEQLSKFSPANWPNVDFSLPLSPIKSPATPRQASPMPKLQFRRIFFTPQGQDRISELNQEISAAQSEAASNSSKNDYPQTGFTLPTKLIESLSKLEQYYKQINKINGINVFRSEKTASSSDTANLLNETQVILSINSIEISELTKKLDELKQLYCLRKEAVEKGSWPATSEEGLLAGCINEITNFLASQNAVPHFNIGHAAIEPAI